MRIMAQQFSANQVSQKLRGGLDGQILQPEIIGVATAFVELQQARHEADYDMGRRFTRPEVLDIVEQSEKAAADWNLVRKSLQADTFLAGLLTFGNIRN